MRSSNIGIVQTSTVESRRMTAAAYSPANRRVVCDSDTAFVAFAGSSGVTTFASPEAACSACNVSSSAIFDRSQLGVASAALTERSLTVERCATLHLAQARALFALNRPSLCTSAVLALNRLAPEEARRPATKAVVETLLGRSGVPPELPRLAHRLGVST